MRRLALVLALVGCGDNLADPGTPRSGNRLKLAWYEYEGGARELETGWYVDNELGVQCTPTRWSDGQRYCTPPEDEAVFINATCTRALGRTLAGAPGAPYFATRFQLASEPVPVPSRLFSRGKPAQAPVSIWQKGTAGCFGPNPPGDEFDYFELGDEIATGDLVRLRRGEPRGSGELAVIDELGDDGLRVPSALYDRRAASECATHDRPNAARLECAPITIPTATYFADTACTQPVLASASGTKPTVATAYFRATSCWQSYAVGAQLLAGPLYADFGSGCVFVGPPAGLSLYVMAEREALPVLARIPASGGPRVQPIARVRGDLSVGDPWMFDAELATDCAHDASLRCVPQTAATVEEFYADSQCSTALHLAFVPSGACDPPSRYATDGEHYYPVLAPYTATIYWLSTGDRCGTYKPEVPTIAHAIGPALDPATFATAELTIDP